MTETDEPEFTALITMLVEAHGREATSLQIRGFWWVLLPFDLPVVKAAIRRAMETSEQLPIPSQLLGYCREMTGKAKQRRQQNSEADVFRAAVIARASGQDVQQAIDDARQRVTDEKNAQRRKDSATLGIDVWT